MANKAITTDRQVAALKPRKSRYEAAIAAVKGLVVRTYPSGVKLFEVRYVTLSEVRRRLILGEYPALSLADAVDQAEAVRLAARRGEDPAGALQAKRHHARTGDTLTELAEAYFEAAKMGLHGGRNRPKRPSTIKVEKSRFGTQIKPALGERRFADIKRADIRQFMRELATSGDFSADYIASVGRTLSSIFAFAVHEERLDANPVSGLTKPLETSPRERMFDEAALRSLWQALSKPIPDGMKRQPRKQQEENGWAPVEPTVSLALRFALLTLTRRQDVAGAQWSEIDVKSKVWVVPSERHKSRKAHVVPLSETAMDLLKAAAKVRDSKATLESGLRGFVFPSRTKKDAHIAETALTKAMTRACESLQLPHGTPHDFRRTGATILTGERAGIRRFIISKVLGHHAKEGADVTEIYDRNEYMPEKRRALEAWEQILMEIAEERERPSNVTELRAGAGK